MGDEPLLTVLESLFNALADETRLQIVLLLINQGALPVQEISRRLGKSQSLISHHLNCLRNCGVVKVERRGKYSYYFISSEEITNIVKLAMNHAIKYSKSILSCDVLNEERQSGLYLKEHTRVNI
ncbi:MAG: metalloregulator ArsR/SmtB family transcription factor [Caldivirga sp.]|jgi:DNA-binding transcriptional ArsR family regulator|nr:metalloregulator ArsR/SmtB family transcription factor [Caldivirga sp.]